VPGVVRPRIGRGVAQAGCLHISCQRGGCQGLRFGRIETEPETPLAASNDEANAESVEVPSRELPPEPAPTATPTLRAAQMPGSLEIAPGRTGEPVRVHVAVDLTGYPATGPLRYAAQVFAKRVGYQDRLTVASLTGSVEAQPQMRLELEGTPFPVGMYRTFAAVTLTPPGVKRIPASC